MARKLSIKYYVEPDAASLARRAAQYFVEMVGEAVAGRGRARIAISGGSTPKATFELLADQNQPWRNRMPWDSLELFWVDERCVPPEDAESNYRMTREALLDQVPLRPEQIHRIEGELEPEAAAIRYESELRGSFHLEGADSPRFDLSAHRRPPRKNPTGHRQSRAAKGRLAHHPHLARHRPRQLSLLPHRRSR